ncbi:hypothetical protein CLOSTMETH_03019 [[Clostridium] methylpentosum DSM 5476]|uniref:Uncharacterized protein n=1 Tax=[Clostridium] methylpentosum DSM 5476 TaxID=537013 RepID=C0EGM6_9FIRM|nr:hypothetical protein CLOSTMETH_03019 [[Clostridium] methylpentosum DSM 5476]
MKAKNKTTREQIKFTCHKFRFYFAKPPFPSANRSLFLSISDRAEDFIKRKGTKKKSISSKQSTSFDFGYSLR